MSVSISGTTGLAGNVSPYLVTGSLSANTSVVGTMSGNLVGNVTGTVTGNLSGNASTAVLATSSLSANTAFTPAPGSQLGLQTCKAWVNFNGAATDTGTIVNSFTGTSISVTAGSNVGLWTISSNAIHVGGIYYITSIGGATNATLGGVNVSNGGSTSFNPAVGVQLTGLSGSTGYTIKLLAGPAISSQTIYGNSAASGFQYYVTGIRSAYNVQSITRNSTGNYTINFATPMNDAYYSISSGAGPASGDLQGAARNGPPTTTAINIATVTHDGTAFTDCSIVTAQIFGN